MMNPFYMKDRVVWRREMPFGTIRGTRFAVLGAMLLPVALVYLLASFDLVTTPADPAFILSAVTWLALVSLLAINAGIHVYPRERELGALELSALTPTSPWKEVVGRFRGAFIAVLEAWLLGLVYVATAWPYLSSGQEALIDTGFAGTFVHLFIAAWLCTLLWFALLTAVALFWSAQVRTSSEAFAATLSTVVVLNVTYTIAHTMGPRKCLLALPLDARMISTTFLEGWSSSTVSVWPMFALVVVPLWLGSLAVVLYATSRIVLAQVPLRRGRAPQGPSGLVPAAPQQALAPSSSTRPSRPPLDFGLTSRLLRAFDGNPFYHAYRKGFLRIFAGESAAPGSVMAAAIMIVGLLTYRSLSESEPTAAAGALLITLTVASVIGACEGLVLGARALSTERDQSTWPMLVVSGMRPSTLLRGKFATAFYALSGEWAIAVPFWIFAALSWHPAVALLALVQPAAIALGILFGLWMASQPRYLLISLHSIGLWLCGLLGGLWLLREMVATRPQGLGAMMQPWNPLHMVNNLAALNTSEGLVGFGAQLALWGTIAFILWNRSDARLQRVLRGE